MSLNSQKLTVAPDDLERCEVQAWYACPACSGSNPIRRSAEKKHNIVLTNSNTVNPTLALAREQKNL